MAAFLNDYGLVWVGHTDHTARTDGQVNVKLPMLRGAENLTRGYAQNSRGDVEDQHQHQQQQQQHHRDDDDTAESWKSFDNR